ncbi:hypothetical protein L917_17713 [Phytophthora nicotianae]|uniref:Uncharacterized protein n=1 Tax=Phytophthora nicotianae TaxID=4792 RepID=W2K9Z3_PHYNI|nr:hypothetical protein L916_17891 [Phytophthora nicotianae]ETL82061.1 hypothetical protein L917_17713 [Phytophthora nicotianae]
MDSGTCIHNHQVSASQERSFSKIQTVGERSPWTRTRHFTAKVTPSQLGFAFPKFAR